MISAKNMSLMMDYRTLRVPKSTGNPIVTDAFNKNVELMHAISQSYRSSQNTSQSQCSISSNYSSVKAQNRDDENNATISRNASDASKDLTLRSCLLKTNDRLKRKRNITFENDSTRTPATESSSFELKSRDTSNGTWVQCCKKTCGKWRFLAEFEDPTELSEKWYCVMNPDKNFSSCVSVQERIPEETKEEFIENKYSVGSIVWARLDGYPWSPAIVDDCPDLLQFYQLKENSPIPIKYHVVFFDPKKIQRAWIPDKDLKAYRTNPRETVVKKMKFRGKNYKSTLDAACALANEAQLLQCANRIKNFGWNALLAKNVNPPLTRRMKYKIGDVLWAGQNPTSRWPAIVDECPILGKHHRLGISRKVEIEYYIVYFNGTKLETDWMPERALKLFSTARRPTRSSLKREKTAENKDRTEEDINDACKLAKEAQRLSIGQRLKRFGVKAFLTPGD